MSKYVMALDQGTTSSRAILFDKNGQLLATDQREFSQILPKPGWVEHDPEEIWQSQLETAQGVLTKANVSASEVAAIGITNQRETTVLWDRQTGKPVANAIVWQSRISAPICDQIKADGQEPVFQAKTGLVVDAYFSGTKVKHLLDTIDGLRSRAEKGDVLFGTIDTFLIWRLTGGKQHITDVSNASRTLMFNIHTLEWDDELLGLLDVPRRMLPNVVSSSEVYGQTADGLFEAPICIAGAAGDQQAATFGQACHTPGSAKNTYGTGCFMLLNTGHEPKLSKNNLLTTVGWKIGDQTTYCLEGSVFIGGAVVQWLRDGLGLIEKSEDIEALAKSVDDNGGVYLVPAFVGLGAPYWDPYARGTIHGITRGTTAGHLARAAVESMAFQSHDVLDAMQRDSGVKLAELKVDGGAAANDELMQFQADMLDTNVLRPKIAETTALGAAFLAGLAVGYWEDVDQLSRCWELDRKFSPSTDETDRARRYDSWQRAVDRSLGWITQGD